MKFFHRGERRDWIFRQAINEKLINKKLLLGMKLKQAISKVLMVQQSALMEMAYVIYNATS